MEGADCRPNLYTNIYNFEWMKVLFRHIIFFYEIVIDVEDAWA